MQIGDPSGTHIVFSNFPEKQLRFTNVFPSPAAKSRGGRPFPVGGSQEEWVEGASGLASQRV